MGSRLQAKNSTGKGAGGREQVQWAREFVLSSQWCCLKKPTGKSSVAGKVFELLPGWMYLGVACTPTPPELVTCPWEGGLGPLASSVWPVFTTAIRGVVWGHLRAVAGGLMSPQCHCGACATLPPVLPMPELRGI